MAVAEDFDDSYVYNILTESEVSHLRTSDGKIDPSNLVQYRDDQNDLVTPEPLYIPKDELEKMRAELGPRREKGAQSVMQTFLKMSSVVYSMAGLGSVEESKLFRDKFGSSTSVPDSLKFKTSQNLFIKREEADNIMHDKEEGIIAELETEDDIFGLLKKGPDKGVLPSATEKKQSIDILLKETDTIWMFILPGTCKEIEGAEEVQRAAKKDAAPEKKDSSNGTDDDGKEEESEVKPEKEVENAEVPEKENVEEKETEKSQEKVEEKSYLKHKYDLNEKWSQTIDFPRKKKGTQSDPIQTHDSFAQVTSKDLLL